MSTGTTPETVTPPTVEQPEAPAAEAAAPEGGKKKKRGRPKGSKKKVTKKKGATEPAPSPAPAPAPAPEAPKAELVSVSGITADIWKDAASTFVPVLKADFTPTQRVEAIRQVLQQSATIDDRLNLVMGELLYEVSENEYWKLPTWKFIDKEGTERGYKNFLEYAQEECGLEKRKSYYLIDIYRLYVVELGLPLEILRNLEWSKAKVLKGVITKENAKEMLDKLNTLSKRELEAFVRTLKAGTPPSTTVPEFVPIKLRLSADQAKNFKDALDCAKGMARNPDGTEASDGACIDFIFTDFLAGQAGPGLDGVLNRLDVLVANIQRTFGVTLKVEDYDKERYAALQSDRDAKQPAETA